MTRNSMWLGLIALQLSVNACALDANEGSLDAEGDTDDDVTVLRQDLTPDPGLTPLVTFFSTSRGDYFTTSNPVWTCQLFGSCARDPSYQAVGVAGYVHRADRPQPAGTAPLYHWWSPSREDNFLTSDPGWAGAVGAIRLEHDGYQLFRIEGYIDRAATSGAVPLDSFWNPGTRDNAAVSSRRVAMPGGWTRYRTEGFLRGPGTPAGNSCRARGAPRFVDDEAWTALGNFDNTWPGGALFDGDALQIASSGQTRIDFWGAHKNCAGEGAAGPGFPAPGEPAWSLIGRATSGRVWVPGRGSYPANVWFPVGANSGCLEYDSQGTSRGSLVLTINDDNRGDNAGGCATIVSQWW
jgi:hypothetical protein